MSDHDDWRSAKDAKGRVYFYNTKSGKSQWDKPLALFDDQELLLHEHGWKANKTPEGKVYFYHAQSGESRWDIPKFEEEKQEVKDEPEAENVQSEGEMAAQSQAIASTLATDGDAKYINTSRILNPPNKSKEAAEKEFLEMLQENQVDSTWSFSKIISQLGATDPRYWMVDDDPLWKQQIFEKYLTNRTEDQLLKERTETEKFKDAFEQMLKSKPQIKYYTRWSTAKRLIANEPIYKHSVVKETVKRKTFEEYAKNLQEENEARNRVLKDQALSELQEYLRNILSNQEIKAKNSEELPILSWQHLLNNYLFEQNKRFMANKHFKALSHEDILVVYLQVLESKEKIMQKKLKSLNDLCYEKDRVARDNFKSLLRTSDLSIRADSKWKDVYPLLKNDERFLRMLGTSGSSALDLFLDYIEELGITIDAHRSMAQTLLIEKKYEWDDKDLDNVINRRNLLQLLKEDPNLKDIDEYDMNLIVNQLLIMRSEKVKQQAEMEQRVWEQKKHFFKIMVLRFYRAAKVKPNWDIAREELKDTVEFKELAGNEDLRKKLYEESLAGHASAMSNSSIGLPKESKKRALTPTVELDY